MVSTAVDNLRAFTEHVRRTIPIVVTLALLVLVAAFLASTYFGDGRGPYGTCYGANGRAVPCSWIEGR